jgi:hypothetical protein
MRMHVQDGGEKTSAVTEVKAMAGTLQVHKGIPVLFFFMRMYKTVALARCH